jgi:predicted membrane protein
MKVRSMNYELRNNYFSLLNKISFFKKLLLITLFTLLFAILLLYYRILKMLLLSITAHVTKKRGKFFLL